MRPFCIRDTKEKEEGRSWYLLRARERLKVDTTAVRVYCDTCSMLFAHQLPVGDLARPASALAQLTPAADTCFPTQGLRPTKNMLKRA